MALCLALVGGAVLHDKEKEERGQVFGDAVDDHDAVFVVVTIVAVETGAARPRYLVLGSSWAVEGVSARGGKRLVETSGFIASRSRANWNALWTQCGPRRER